MPAAGTPTPSSPTSSWRPRGAEAAAGRSHARPNRTTRIAQRGEASSGGGTRAADDADAWENGSPSSPCSLVEDNGRIFKITLPNNYSMFMYKR